MAYKVINLEDLYKAIGEEKIKETINNYECALNKDVEYFIKNKAIEFSKQGISKTFFVYTSYNKENVFVGYFSLKNSPIKIKKSLLSNTSKERIEKFAKNDLNSEESEYYIISTILIGQLGKNYYKNYNNLITGDELLKLAFDIAREIQKICGGKYVYIECEDKDKLKEFYFRNGFKHFENRILDNDETDKNTGEYLLQMIRYLK